MSKPEAPVEMSEDMDEDDLVNDADEDEEEEEGYEDDEDEEYNLQMFGIAKALPVPEGEPDWSKGARPRLCK